MTYRDMGTCQFLSNRSQSLEDRMAMGDPEARAFRMDLEVLQDRNSRIGGSGIAGRRVFHKSSKA
jgi:hypothetical protein